jgi:[acyl-carrier-protein] S-malonyltransferase
MKAYLFPGQGAQFVGMANELYESSTLAKEMFLEANEILGFQITDVMFNGTDEELKQTSVTQPAIFLHSVILAATLGSKFKPDMVAGHSLGEISALVATKALSFQSGLKLVIKRSNAMQKACLMKPSTMAAILGLEDRIVEEICASVADIVVPANYNCPGQLVISGTIPGINAAKEALILAGAKRVLPLNVNGAFHSPLMEPARAELEKAIQALPFSAPICPVYQNVNGLPVIDPEEIQKNLIAQLTAPVRWTQTMQNMLASGAISFAEVGPGKVLQGLVKKVNRDIEAYSVE